MEQMVCRVRAALPQSLEFCFARLYNVRRQCRFRQFALLLILISPVAIFEQCESLNLFTQQIPLVVYEQSLTRKWIFRPTYTSPISGSLSRRPFNIWRGEKLITGDPMNVDLRPNRLAVVELNNKIHHGVWSVTQTLRGTQVQLEIEDSEHRTTELLQFTWVVSPGSYQPASLFCSEGFIRKVTSPFLPWNKFLIGRFSVRLKVPKSIIDANLK